MQEFKENFVDFQKILSQNARGVGSEQKGGGGKRKSPYLC